MKKYWILAAILALVLVSAFWATSVSANGGPHGGYTATTDACAGCHRAHTAQGPKLLKDSSTYNLCMSCHGAGVTGSTLNVADGDWEATGGGDLNGGGFTNYKLAAITSNHDATGSNAAAWGNAAARGVNTNPLSGGNLTCASCHDPHGSPNYRIIKGTVNSTSVTVAQVDEASKDYDNENWGTGIPSLCAACHSAYLVTQASSGSIDAGSKIAGQYGNDTSTWAHRINMGYTYGSNVNPETTGYSGYFLPLAETGTNNTVVCTTCHLPHGSSSVMSGFADGTGLPGGTRATDSALLRLDNRGVCEVCHQK